MLIKIRVGEIKPTVMGKCEFEKQQKSVLVAFFGKNSDETTKNE